MISQNEELFPGGLIELSGDWLLGHFRGPEGYLGRLCLQPRYHRDGFADLTADEAAAFAQHVGKLESGLRQYWSIKFPADPLERVYVAAFFETEGYHMHIHLLPRPRSFLWMMSETSFDAWTIARLPKKFLTSGFPAEYQIWNNVSESERKGRIEPLMAYLREVMR